MRPLRALVLNDFLANWTGSEIVAKEVAEHWGATTSSFWCADPMKSVLKDWRPLEEIDLSGFDIVWAQQHALFTLLDKLEDGKERPFIVWASLSPYDVMDDIPQSVLRSSVDIVMCNSAETMAARCGDCTFDNAAPNAFHFRRDHRPLKNILFVSNHPPKELIEAATVLASRGYILRHIGDGRISRLIEPEDFRWADCVVTIGKTARYALASQTPVYIYDRFGGDGYLTQANYESNKINNFSGRPGCRKLSASELADEIIGRYSIFTMPAQPMLGTILDDLARKAGRVTMQRHPDLASVAKMSAAIGSFLAQARAWEGTARTLGHGGMNWTRWCRLGLRMLRQKLQNSSGR